MAQRQGKYSRLIWYPETVWNADPAAAGFILPLRDQAEVGNSDEIIEVEAYDGTGLPPSVLSGMLTHSGSLPLLLEYLTSGYLFKSFVGTNGYLRPGAGTNTLHHFFPSTTAGSLPGSGQLQAEWLETTAQYLRDKGVMISGVKFNNDVKGAAGLDVDYVGSGTEVQTDLAGSKTDNLAIASTHFNGYAKYAGTSLVDLASANVRLFADIARTDSAFNGGIAAGLTAGFYKGEGELEILMNVGGSGPSADLSFFNDAVAGTEIALDFLWANGPLATCTRFARVQIPVTRFRRKAPGVGGAAGRTVRQSFMVPRSANANTSAEYFGPTLGTYNIAAGTANLGVKIDGAGTITIAMTTGAARTATQVVADLTGNVGFTAVATADVFCGRVRITSKTTGTTSSVQIDTAVPNSGHALFGFDNVARTGKSNTPYVIHLFNTKGTDY